MKQLAVIALTCTICILATGCGESKAQKEARIQANMQLAAEKYVRAKLKDPDSAQFQNQRISAKDAACGEVNARGGFGGYTGFKRYISAGKDMTVIEADTDPAQFESVWQKVCT